jgi:hypothetical protein
MSTAIVVGAERLSAAQSAVLQQLFLGRDAPQRQDVEIDQLERKLPALLEQFDRPVLIGIGAAAASVWQLAGKLDSLGATLLIHPDELPDFMQHKLQQTCLLIHSSNTKLTSAEMLKSLQRPRPDIAQLVNDQPAELAALMRHFINQFSGARPESLGRIIRCGDIARGFPVPAPGSQPIFEDENCYVGAVQPDQYDPFEHINYRDELHVVIRGTGHFRHGNGEMIEVKQGDLAYVKAYEKHRWSDWSPDFKLLFIQTGPDPLKIH